jgi:hypothetical protein
MNLRRPMTPATTGPVSIPIRRPRPSRCEDASSAGGFGYANEWQPGRSHGKSQRSAPHLPRDGPGSLGKSSECSARRGAGQTVFRLQRRRSRNPPDQTHNPLLRLCRSRRPAVVPLRLQTPGSSAAAVLRAVNVLHRWRRCVRDLVQGIRTSSSKPLSTRVDSVGARPRAKTLPSREEGRRGPTKPRRAGPVGRKTLIR